MARPAEALNTDTTDDAALAALGFSRLSDPDHRRPVLDLGTRVTLGVQKVEFVPASEKAKPRIEVTFEYQSPEEVVGETISERYSVNATPRDPRKPQNTGMAMTIVGIQRIVAAIRQVPVAEAASFFDGLAIFKDDIIGGFVPELVSRLEELVGTTFETDLELGTSKAGKKYNTLGVPVYPDPENKRSTPQDRPYREWTPQAE